jgi:hypothetical protein
MKKYLIALLAVCLLAPAASFAQQEPMGRIKRLAGTVSLERGGKTLPVEVGTLVFQGDRLRTGRDGYAGLTLADDTLLTAGPGSLLVLNRFAFNATTLDGEFKATLPQGNLQVVSGLIAKKSPEKFELKGRNVVLGVRGTEFILSVPGEAAE